jgi:hypothetical protein
MQKSLVSCSLNNKGLGLLKKGFFTGHRYAPKVLQGHEKLSRDFQMFKTFGVAYLCPMKKNFQKPRNLYF